MADLVALGELLVDMIADTAETGVAEANCFVPVAGGAPANVAVGAARLGTRTAFLGKVGDDPFGHKLAALLEQEEVDVAGLRFDGYARTGLAFVGLGKGGEREFTFFRHPAADMLYRPDEVDLSVVRSARTFHFGSISLIAEPSRAATLAAVEAAVEAGVLVSYDPNLRLELWENPDAARDGILLGLKMAGVVKVSEEELSFLTGGTGSDAARSLMHHGLDLLVVTRGAAGAEYFTAEHHDLVPGLAVEAVDTTGAGDSFVAALLNALTEFPETVEHPSEVQRVLRFANACAALTTTRRGAIPAMPAREEAERLIARRP